MVADCGGVPLMSLMIASALPTKTPAKRHSVATVKKYRLRVAVKTFHRLCARTVIRHPLLSHENGSRHDSAQAKQHRVPESSPSSPTSSWLTTAAPARQPVGHDRR